MLRRLAPGSVWVVAVATLLLHLACLGGYGYFRDELYFIACGRHLAWGYVDQPPLIPLVTRLAEALSFGSLTLFRLPANLAHAATVLLAGNLARRLGAQTFGCVSAAGCVAVAPVLLATGQLLTMNAFEPLLLTALVLVVLSILQGGNERRWLIAGALVGAGVLNKHSVVFFALCLAVALAALPEGRRRLWSRWAAGGVAVAALMVLPHAIWQVRAGFPMLELLRNGQQHKNTPFELLGLWKGQLLEMSPAAAPLLLAGLVWLLTRHGERREARLLGLTCILAELLFVALKAKSYYLAPLYPLLFAAGGAAVEAWLAGWPRARWALPAVAMAVGAIPVPAVLPVLPVQVTERYLIALGLEPPHLEQMAYRVLPQHLADQFGWPEMAASVAAVFSRLTADERARAAVYAPNYGEAGAIDFFGRSLGIPPASSGHNNYFLWGFHGDGSVVIVIGGEADGHRRYYDEVELAGRTPPNPHGLPYEDGRPIYVLRRPKVPISEIWPSLKLYI